MQNPWRALSFLQGIEFKLADDQLESLRLEEDLAGRGIDVVAFVDGGAVDTDGDALALAEALDPGPFAQGAFRVVLAARIKQLLVIRVMERPPELSIGEDLWLAALLPAGMLVGPQDNVAGELDGDY